MKINEILNDEKFNGVITKIKYINARFLVPSEKEFYDQKQNMKYWLDDNPGKTKEDWAKYWLDKSKPIQVKWMGCNGWDMDVNDGHHRLMAYKILGLMPRVTITAVQVPKSYIETLIKEDRNKSFQKGGPDED
jgi:hypothetical protein